jgi:hypothetical protein
VCVRVGSHVRVRGVGDDRRLDAEPGVADLDPNERAVARRAAQADADRDAALRRCSDRRVDEPLECRVQASRLAVDPFGEVGREVDIKPDPLRARVGLALEHGLQRCCPTCQEPAALHDEAATLA